MSMTTQISFPLHVRCTYNSTMNVQMAAQDACMTRIPIFFFTCFLLLYTCSAMSIVGLQGGEMMRWCTACGPQAQHTRARSVVSCNVSGKKPRSCVGGESKWRGRLNWTIARKAVAREARVRSNFLEPGREGA